MNHIGFMARASPYTLCGIGLSLLTADYDGYVAAETWVLYAVGVGLCVALYVWRDQ